MNKYEWALEQLISQGEVTFKVFGTSMMPLIKTESILTFKKTDDYQVGDVVFCRVHGNYIDAHLVTQIDSKGRYLISNNHGHNNGWTKKVFARVIAVNGKPFGRKVSSDES